VALFFDAQGTLLSLQRLALARADLGGKEMLFTAGTSARPGAIKCRIVLRDMDTGQSAVASTVAYIGPSNRQSLSVFTPLVLVEGGGLFHLEGVVKGKAESPAWRELYPYDCVSSRENTRKNRLKIPMSRRVRFPSAFAA
jgi:hypothetical protein